MMQGHQTLEGCIHILVHDVANSEIKKADLELDRDITQIVQVFDTDCENNNF